MNPHELAEKINSSRAARGEPPIHARVVNGCVVSDPVRATPTLAELNGIAARARALDFSAAKSLAEKRKPRKPRARRGGRQADPANAAQKDRVRAFLKARPSGATASEICDGLAICSLERIVYELMALERAGQARFRKECRTVKGVRGGERLLKVWSLTKSGGAS